MTKLTDPLRPVNVMVCLYSKPVRSNLELPERDPNSVHPMLEGILGSNNKSISDLQKVLNVEGHLWAQSARRIDPCSLNVLPVDVLLDYF